jgi:hypothetical protein
MDMSREGRRSHPAGRLNLGIWLGLALCSVASAWAQAPVFDESGAAPQTFTLKDTRGSFKSDKPVRPVPSERLGLSLSRVAEVRLGAVDVDGLLREDEKSAREGYVKSFRYGLGRDLEVAALDGEWFDLDGGAKLWVTEVASSEALGVRLRFSNVNLPAGAEIAIYSPDEQDARDWYLKTGSSAPERFVDFYDSINTTPGGAFWSGTVFGERARIEYYVPAKAAAEELPFTVNRLQHIYVDPVAKTLAGLAKAAGPCHNDVTCFPEWGDIARAVAGIGTVGQNSLFCTGQLLNSQKSDLTPYWLTANHCLDSAGEAQSAEIYWFYQTSNCGGGAPSLGNVPRSRGATLLSTSTTSDYTLLLVEGTVPAGVVWAGWTSAQIANGVPVTAVHHPRGDFKRISFGNKGAGSDCGVSFINDSNHVRINWSNAPTEPGSSGSGIFLNSTQQLFGQLHCGPSSCSSESNDSYGSFSVTYPRIKNFLKAGTDDSSEQNDSCAKAKPAKAGTLGNRIVKFGDTDYYKVKVPAGRTVHVTASFNHANGDVDLKAFGSCKGGAVASSEGSGNTETVSLKNTGRKAAFAYFQLFLADDVRNNYNLSVSLSK